VERQPGRRLPFSSWSRRETMSDALSFRILLAADPFPLHRARDLSVPPGRIAGASTGVVRPRGHGSDSDAQDAKEEAARSDPNLPRDETTEPRSGTLAVHVETTAARVRHAYFTRTFAREFPVTTDNGSPRRLHDFQGFRSLA
jgi:hypothetical protein